MERPEDIIESYLTNKLSTNEKEAFEAELASDPNLKAQTELQSYIIESIKKARVAELKATLSKVKIESSPLFATSTKIAASIAILGLIAFLFYPFTPNEKLSEPQIKIKIKPLEADKPALESITKKEIQAQDKTLLLKKITPEPSKRAEELRKSDVVKPTIKVVDPSQEFENTSEEPVIIKSGRNYISLANIIVENDASDKKYTFHYKFHKGKLILYGTFDSSLYEILEINGLKRSVFLYYKEKFYILDENQMKIKMLESIQDPTLIQKLNEYRVSKK